MLSLQKSIRRKGLLVSDGAWGTLLLARGMRLGECPELWNVERPEVVGEIARLYVEAGADVIMTNSFGGTPLRLEAFGLAHRAAELNEAAARLSREAAGDTVHVLASMGPTGKILMTGEATEEELFDSFAIQAKALERGGADACSVETMAALDEASLAVRAVKENTALEVVCSFTFTMRTEDGYRTMMGVSPEQAAVGALAAGADVLGANCTLGSAEMIEVVAALHRAAPDVPILVHPNAGQPIPRSDGSVLYPETPEMMAANVGKLVEAGATIVGGCCGTGPDHIRAIRTVVERLRA